jgi:hypothetical protein
MKSGVHFSPVRDLGGKRKLPRRHRFATFAGLPELVFIIGNVKSVRGCEATVERGWRFVQKR